MFRRFAAVLFVLIFATQLLASGLCVCFTGQDDDHAEMPCCKPDESGQASVSRQMGCCEGEAKDNENRIPGSQSISNVQIPAPILTAVEKLLATFKPKPDFSPKVLISKRSGDFPLLSAKPPELYLRNHAFLI